MESLDGVGDRFQKAALRVCERWGCLDFSNAGDVSNATMAAIKRRIETGGAEAIQPLLHSESPSDGFLELWARDRLDLTLEALCLRPAWSQLFTPEERSVAAKRLIKALADLPSSSLPSPFPSDIEATIRWLNERLLWIDDRTIGMAWYCPPNDRHNCALFAQTVRELQETGFVKADFPQRRHYWSCSNCATLWSEFEPLISKLDTLCFDCWRQNLKVLITCLDFSEDRLERLLASASLVPGGSECPIYSAKEALAWRAIVCGQGAHLPRPDFWRWSLSSESDAVLRAFASGLTDKEVFGIFFAGETFGVVLDLQIDVFSAPGQIGIVDIPHMLLPTDGDLSSIPDVVEVVRSADLHQWWKIMTGREVTPDELGIVGAGLFELLSAVAHLKVKSADDLLNRESWRTPQNDNTQRIDGSVQIQLNDLRDSIESNSAAQIPIIDSLQELVRRMDSRSRHSAEASLRTELLDTYYSLCPSARNAAIVAEYCFLDANFPDPSKIVVDLATAFERQLRERVLKAFCDYLLATGASNYPEGRSELPVLFREGRMSKKLNLGAMKLLLDRPLPTLSSFLKKFGLDAARLAEILSEITKKRNYAAHEGGLLREEAEDIRRSWFGHGDPTRSIFAALIRKSPQEKGDLTQFT